MKGMVSRWCRWGLCCFWLLLAAGTAFAGNPAHEVYVIGDSLSDTGSFYELTGFWPPSPPYAQRFSNGPVWPEYLADDLDVDVDSISYGGAFTGTYIIEGVPLSNFNNVQYPQYFPDPLPGVPDEIDMLLAEYPGGLNPKALYVVWAGPNDMFLGMMQPEAMQSILTQAVANIAEDVCRLGTAGARHFMVGNMPDLSKTPFVLGLGPDVQYQVSQAVMMFNAGLEQTLAGLPDACAETINIFDSYQVVNDLVASPADYGLANVTDSCLMPDLTVCDDPDTYMFWDTVHPTTKVHQIFADRFRADFCNKESRTPGLRGKVDEMPPPWWRGVCFGKY